MIPYKIECQGCLAAGKSAEYEGESARNGFFRGLEHQDEDSPLCQLVHIGEKQAFSNLLLEAFKAALKDKSTRQSGFLPTLLNHILNSKSEFHEAPIVRVVTTNGLKTEQGEEEVVVRGRGGGRRAERGQ